MMRNNERKWDRNGNMKLSGDAADKVEQRISVRTI
jgi:hypothetical protein